MEVIQLTGSRCSTCRVSTRLEGSLIEGGAVEFIRRGFVREIDQMDREACRYTVVRTMLLEERRIRPRVRLAQAVLLARVAQRIGERVGRFRLRSERMHLEKVDI